MKINLNKLSKRQKEIYNNDRCKHCHTYLEHPACFLSEKHTDLKIGFLDIEASNLHSDFGIIFSYCIKELNGPLLARCVSTNDLHKGYYDKNLIKQFIKDCKKFDKLVVYYGGDRRFDMPFLRTRALFWKLNFPTYKNLFLTDVYPIMRNKFRFHSNRLGTICEFLNIPAKEHKLLPQIWFRAMSGKKDALNYILRHNKEDVISLEELYKRVILFTNNVNTSI